MDFLSTYISQLDSNTNDTLQLAKSCSETQLNFHEKEQWSILQILEHIFITDQVVIALISKPSDKTSDSEEIVGNKKLEKLIVEARSFKVKAPEILHPKGTIKDANEFEINFLAQRESLKKNLQSQKILIDNRIFKHPFLGEMTVIDWLHFIIHHTQRHLEQIKDLLKENSNQK